MEVELIEHLAAELRIFVPDIRISAVKSFVGENFWSFEIAQNECRGSGAALDAPLAFQKATSEFIERDAFRVHSKVLNAKTSNGFAAHINLEAVQAAARSELIERDILTLSWFADIKPCWISDAKLSLSGLIYDRVKFLESIGIHAKFGILGKSTDVIVAAGMLDFDSFSNHGVSWAFTTEAASNLQLALEKAVMSLLRIANLVITRSLKKTALFFEVDPRDISKPEHHLEFHLDPKHRGILEGWWNSDRVEVVDFGAENIECIELKTEFSTRMRRFVAFARSSILIPYFVGIPSEFDLICQRLSMLGLIQRRDFDVIHPLS